MGAGALAVCQSKAAVKLKEDMKKIVTQPMSRQQAGPASDSKTFGVPLVQLQQRGLLTHGVPHVVWNTVEYLKRDGLTQEGIFRVNGNVKVVEQLRVRYESGADVDLDADGDVYSAASLLKLFLRELPDGVVTSELHPRFLQLYQDNTSEAEREKGLKELLQELPEVHHRLLNYLCHFLVQVAKHHSQNRMNIFNLATVFGPNCFHVPPGFEGMKEQAICNKIMAKLLADFNIFFESEDTVEKEELCDDMARIITVKEVAPELQSQTLIFTFKTETDAPKPLPRTKNIYDQPPPPVNFPCADDRASQKHSPSLKYIYEQPPPPVNFPCEDERDSPKPSPRLKLSQPRMEGAILQPVSMPIPVQVPQPGSFGGIPQVSLRITSSSRGNVLEALGSTEDEEVVLINTSTELLTRSLKNVLNPFWSFLRTETCTSDPFFFLHHYNQSTL